MNPKVKRVFLVIMGIFFLLCLGIWLMACLFAAGQLNDSYNLWDYFSDAPVSVLIVIGLGAASVASFVGAVRARSDRQEKGK